MNLSELIDQNPMIADLPLRRAAFWADDGDTFWRQTMSVVMELYPAIGPSEYWNLTVGEHAALLPSLTPESDQ